MTCMSAEALEERRRMAEEEESDYSDESDESFEWFKCPSEVVEEEEWERLKVTEGKIGGIEDKGWELVKEMIDIARTLKGDELDLKESLVSMIPALRRNMANKIARASSKSFMVPTLGIGP